MHAPDAEYTRWIGRTETIDDTLAPAQADAAAATLDRDGAPFRPGQPLPPLWQWFYFHAPVPQHTLAADGHAPRGDFLPPVPQPRRMFAGARITVHHPLRLGEAARREGEIRDVTMKTGRSGSLAFVRVGYRYLQGGALCIEEEQDIVYRDPSPAGGATASVALPAPSSGVHTRLVHPDARLLFRFSALTFNAHRIHYDRDYARGEEGYPGLVVHGQLIAMLLLALAEDVAAPEARVVQSFAFRSERPVFDGAPLRLAAEQLGATVRLDARGPDGLVAQGATATFRVEPSRE